MATEAKKTITMSEYFDQIQESVSEDFLQKGISRTPQGVTCNQLAEHGIDACVVTYLDNDLMCVNPVSWARTDYYISDVFTKGEIKFKVFLGNSD